MPSPLKDTDHWWHRLVTNQSTPQWIFINVVFKEKLFIFYFSYISFIPYTGFFFFFFFKVKGHYMTFFPFLFKNCVYSRVCLRIIPNKLQNSGDYGYVCALSTAGNKIVELSLVGLVGKTPLKIFIKLKLLRGGNGNIKGDVS